MSSCGTIIDTTPDHRHHALIAVAAGHLVARLDAALDRQVNLDHLEYAGGQIITLHQLAAFLVELLVECLALLIELPGDFFELIVEFLGLHPNFEPAVTRQVVEIVDADRCVATQTVWSPFGQISY